MLAMQRDTGPSATPLEKAVRSVDEISTLPHVAIGIMRVANDPQSGAGDLKRVIEGDAAFSARILRCVNSSAYATRVKVTNLQQAIAYLGMKQIRNLAMAASVSELFKQDEKIDSYCRSQLWRHLLSVGICSRLLAMRLKLSNFEDIFLAGLLHDIGIILEDQHLHEPFCKMLRSLDKGKTLAATEQLHLGFDHMIFADKVAAKWGLPPGVRASIHYHHLSEHYKGEDLDTVRCVEIANFICSAKGITSVGMPLVAFSVPAMQGLGLTKDDIVVLAEDLDRELASSKDLLQV